MATIYDVAKLAGVSPKTVSRVLNGDAPVSQRTKDLVSKAMAELEYIPSVAARSIKSQKSGLIGLVTGAISTASDTPHHAGLPEIQIVQGAQHVFEAAGKTLLISDTGGKLERVPDLIRTFREHRVEGLLYVADYHKHVDLDLPSGTMKTVLVNCFDDQGTPSVLPDDANGQLELTRKVVAAGHRRIGYVTLGRAQLATKLRLNGYKQALGEAGVEFDPELVASTDLFGTPGEHQLIWDALDRFFKLASPPTAICCGNDRLAMAVYGILRDRGVVVPDQVSVVGYDDYRLVSETLFPALTTAELPYNAMGARSAHLLLDQIESADETRQKEPVLVNGQVVQRDSLKPPSISESIIDLKGRRKP